MTGVDQLLDCIDPVALLALGDVIPREDQVVDDGVGTGPLLVVVVVPVPFCLSTGILALRHSIQIPLFLVGHYATFQLSASLSSLKALSHLSVDLPVPSSTTRIHGRDMQA